jgi:hypothetical protein
MERIIAFCGLDCTRCPAYIATQADDLAAKERVAARWREEYHAPNIDVAYVTCDGCLAFAGRLGGHCPECEIRICGVARGVANCAHCPDYVCQRLGGFFGFVPEARSTLDEIRHSLQLPA